MLSDHIGIPQLREMASRSEQIVGEIGLKDLSRLSSVLHSATDAEHSCLDVRLSFHRGAQGFPEISGSVSGLVGLRCQRCLGVLDWPLSVSFRVAIVASDLELEEIADPFDTIVAGADGVDIAKLVEDEILGSLPLAPMHEHIEECADPEFLEQLQNSESTGRVRLAEEHPAAETNRPFADLGVLLTGRPDTDTKD